MTFDPTNAEHRADMRYLIGDGKAMNLVPLARALGCEPTRAAVLAELDRRDGMAPARQRDWRRELRIAADTQHTAALTWQECRAVLDALDCAEAAVSG